jgi:hypothetical protein
MRQPGQQSLMLLKKYREMARNEKHLPFVAATKHQLFLKIYKKNL